jgi:hypothetical protein
MKKLLTLCVVFVFAAGTIISASSESTSNTTEVEEVGCASDCVRKSKAVVQAVADYNGVDPNVYVDNGDYMDLYLNCYYGNCV